MRLGRLLADPWTVGAGGFIGALATAGLGLPVAIGVAAGLGGYAVGTAVKALTGRHDRGREAGPSAPVLPPPGTDARALYERARAAVGELGELAEAQGPGPLRDQAVDVRARAQDALDGIARIAGQTVVLERALARVDEAQVRRDLRRLEQARDHEPSAASYEEALAAVRSQLAVAARLGKAQRDACARLLSAVVGLESLVASMAEVVAMAHGSWDGNAGERIRELAASLTGLREGLAEAEETSRQALSA